MAFVMANRIVDISRRAILNWHLDEIKKDHYCPACYVKMTFDMVMATLTAQFLLTVRDIVCKCNWNIQWRKSFITHYLRHG